MALVPPLDRSVLDDPSATPEDLVAVITAAEQLKNQAAALQARAAVRLEEVTRRHHREDLRVPAPLEGRGVASEVALARRESPTRGQRHLGLARALVGELPHALAAMEAGELTEEQALILARETACLDPADRRVVDARLCGVRGDGSYPFTGWGVRRFTAEATRAVAQVDVAALVERRAHAEAERHVSIRPMPDAMAQVTALLPAAQGVAVYAALKRAADTAASTGDPRSRGQVQADTLVERVTGQETAAAVPIRVNLTVSDQALTGGGHEPGWLAGYGTVSAETARSLVTTATATATATGQALATWRRVYTDPAGRLVALESSDRLFGPELAELLGIRDRICRTPWCDAPIRHADHVTDAAAGGPTSATNGQGLCAFCNYAKQAPGWTSTPIPDPDTGLHTVDITTPAGQHLRSTAPPLPVPDPLRPPHARSQDPPHPRLEIGFHLLELDYDAA